MKPRPDFGLRPATRDEFAFAEALHINAMRPLMERLGTWDEPLRRGAIRRSFKAADSQIITYGSRDIGWMQVSERDTDYLLAQIQILEEYCGLGIGSQILHDLLEKAAREGRTVSLSAVRGNRAIELYERLGFRILNPEASPIIDMVWSGPANEAAK